MARALTAAALIAASTLIGAGQARAQDASDDAAIEALIKAVDDDAKKTDDEKKADDAKVAEEPGKAQEPKEPQEPKKPEVPAKPKGEELSGKDKELESLLESLGGTTDEPTAKDERKPPGGPSDEKDEDQGQGPGDQKDQPQDKDRRPGMTDKDKALEEELEELAGRRRKRQGDDQGQGRGQGQGEGEGSGPMGELIKEMREVEKRLGEPDTGEETRGRQQQLVKRMETLIEQIRQQQQQQQSRSMQRQTAQQGGKPGDQPGDQPGDNAAGAPNQRPSRPTDRRSLAGGKDAWGHLPPELRQEMENVAKEDALPSSQELIRRYYLSVSRGRLNRGE